MYLYGASEQPHDFVHGIALIEKAAALKSQGALRTLAEFYTEGLFGYSQDTSKARKLLEASEGDDVLLI